MKHELKIKPEYFAAIYFGEKTFEIRNNADVQEAYLGGIHDEAGAE